MECCELRSKSDQTFVLTEKEKFPVNLNEMGLSKVVSWPSKGGES